MIDVIIPAYNAHKTIERTLYSIAYQRNSEDFSVYIINDNSAKDYSKEIDFFKDFINIKELKLNENKGPGYARQYGFDQSNSEYVVFIDSDDIFATPLSVITLYKKIEQESLDVVFSTFLEETSDNKFNIFNNDDIALHGKIYRRKFLEDNNIRFPNYYAEEDNAFNHLVLLYNPKMDIVSEKTYIWMNNENSLTRKGNYRENSIYNYSKSMLYALECGIKGKCSEKNLASLSYESLLTIYYGFDFLNKNKKLIKNIKKIKKIYDNYILEISDVDKFNILQYKMKCAVSEGYTDNVLSPLITFDEFLNEIKVEEI